MNMVATDFENRLGCTHEFVDVVTANLKFCLTRTHMSMDAVSPYVPHGLASTHEVIDAFAIEPFVIGIRHIHALSLLPSKLFFGFPDNSALRSPLQRYFFFPFGVCINSLKLTIHAVSFLTTC